MLKINTRPNAALPGADGSPHKDQFLSVSRLPRGLRSPARGGKIIAQGKAAEAAALGKEPPHPTSFFPSGLARQSHAKPEGKKTKSFRIGNPRPRCACLVLSSHRPYTLT